jgi:hypothetical protein
MTKALAWQNKRQKNRLPDERAESSAEGISLKDGLLSHELRNELLKSSEQA